MIGRQFAENVTEFSASQKVARGEASGAREAPWTFPIRPPVDHFDSDRKRTHGRLAPPENTGGGTQNS